MIWRCLPAVLLLGITLAVEHFHHGPNAEHQNAEGEHEAAFDHEAVLGSEDLEEEFAGLSHEEARRRLVELAKQHDEDNDGFITKSEMYKWMVQSFKNLDHEEAIEKFTEEDVDGDGQVIWPEYLSKLFGLSPQDVEEMRTKTDSVDRLEHERTLKIIDEDFRRFKGADLDGNDGLNDEEYPAFFSPQTYPHLHQFEVEEYMEDHDKDQDRKISLSEFTPDGANKETEVTAKENFAELDKDGDGVLNLQEIQTWVVPNDDEMAEEEAEHLMSLADSDDDGKLSLEEIADKTKDFVGSSVTDYGRTLQIYHEEL